MPGQVCVGIGVLVVRSDGAVLLGRRKGAHGSGTWALPGGWLEKNESFVACARRELEEETGLVGKAVGEGKVLPVVANNVMDLGVHSVTVFVRMDLRSDDDAAAVRVLEPDKCFEWRWVRPKETLPQPMFPPLEYLVASDYWRAEIVGRGQRGSLLHDLPLLVVGAALGVAAMTVLRGARGRA